MPEGHVLSDGWAEGRGRVHTVFWRLVLLVNGADKADWQLQRRLLLLGRCFGTHACFRHRRGVPNGLLLPSRFGLAAQVPTRLLRREPDRLVVVRCVLSGQLLQLGRSGHAGRQVLARLFLRPRVGHCQAALHGSRCHKWSLSQRHLLPGRLGVAHPLCGGQVHYRFKAGFVQELPRRLLLLAGRYAVCSESHLPGRPFLPRRHQVCH